MRYTIKMKNKIIKITELLKELSNLIGKQNPSAGVAIRSNAEHLFLDCNLVNIHNLDSIDILKELSYNIELANYCTSLVETNSEMKQLLDKITVLEDNINSNKTDL